MYYMEKKDARKMDRFTQYAVAASIMAVKDAGLEINDENAERVGVWIGSGIGGMETFENQFENFLKKRVPKGKSIFCADVNSGYGYRTSIDYTWGKRI